MKRKRDPAPRHKSTTPTTVPFVKDWKLLGAGTFGVVTRVTLVGSYGNEESFAVKWIPVSEPPSVASEKMEVEEMPEEDEEEDVTLFGDAVDEVVVQTLLSELVLDHAHPEPGLGAKRIVPRSTRSFLRTYGAFVVRLAVAERSTYPPALHGLLDTLVELKKNRGHYLCMVTELADLGALHAMKVLGRGTDLLTQNPGYAVIAGFELCWGLYCAHTRTGLLYHGDINSRNIVFSRRRLHNPGSRVGVLRYRLLGVNDQAVGEWCIPIAPTLPQAHWIDFGFSSVVSLPKGQATNPGNRDMAYHPPPELYFGRDDMRDDRSDVWQVGVLLFTLLAPLPPDLLDLRVRATKPGSMYTQQDRVLSDYMHLNVLDCIDIPLYWVMGQAESREVKPIASYADRPSAFEEAAQRLLHGTEWFHLHMQGNIGARFVQFLTGHDALPQNRDLLKALAEDHEFGADKYARYISIGLLQHVLGNGWFPNPGAAGRASYAKSAFYRCLCHPAVQRFWNDFILPEDLPLLRMMRAMVGALAPGCRDLLQRMLQWDARGRPSMEEVLLHPWWQEQFPSRTPHNPEPGLCAKQTRDERVCKVHSRLPMRPGTFDFFSLLTQVERDERAFLTEQQREVRDMLKEAPVFESHATLEEALFKAIPGFAALEPSNVEVADAAAF